MSTEKKFSLSRIQGYDSGGQYWGAEAPLYQYDSGGQVRARDRTDVKAKIREPRARFYR